MAKTIAHILPSLGTGGGQTTVYGLVQGLTDYRHMIIVHKAAVGSVSHLGIDKARIMFGNPEKIIEQYKPEIVHFSGIISNGTLDLRRISYKPNVVWVAQTTGARPIVGATRYAACSEFIAQATSFPKSTNVVIIPNAAQSHFFSKTCSPDNRIVGRHCRFAMDKFSSTYWTNLKRIHDRHPDVRFMIMGDGHYKNDAWKEVYSLGLNNVTIFTGNLTSTSVANMLSKFAVYYHHTREWKEGWSLAISEAMAVGVPVVCDNKGGNSETVDSAKFGGFCVDQHDDTRMVDLIDELLSNRDLWNEMSSNAKKDATARMSNKAMCNSYRGLFQ